MMEQNEKLWREDDVVLNSTPVTNCPNHPVSNTLNASPISEHPLT